MTDLDLSQVHPLRWKEIRGRIGVVKAYLEQSDHSLECREQFAKQLKLSVGQFRRLTRSWEIHRDAAAISGARSIPRFGIERSDGIGSKMLDLISDGIAIAGAHSTIAKVTDEISRQCHQAGVSLPAPAVVWKYLMEARSSSTERLPDIDTSIVIGRVWFELPVEAHRNERLRLPECLIALDLPTRRVLAWTTNTQLGRPPTLTDLLPTLPQNATIRATDLEAGHGTIAPQDARLLIDDGAQAEIVRYIGWRIGDVSVKYRRPRKDPAKLVSSARDAALNRDDAILAISYAIQTHNERLENS